MYVDINQIIPKFYDEKERWLKAQSTQMEMAELLGQIGPLVAEMHAKGYSFNIFHLDPQKGVMHASLLHCCGPQRSHAVDVNIRKEIVDPIITTTTRYKKIVWEDLRLIGVRYP